MFNHRLAQAIESVEKAQLLVVGAQANNNVQDFQKAQQQLMLAKKLVLEVNKDELTEGQKLQLKRVGELLRNINEAKDVLQSM